MPVTKKLEFNSKIVTADFEALILPETGENYLYMASWYNGTKINTFDISQFGFNRDKLLNYFWTDLISENFGRTCYFHNWGGYDVILSLHSLLNLPKDYTYNPVFNNGEMMSITIMEGNNTVLTIKDSIRLLPSSLARLAKDWHVETQKDHFPHYFWDGSIQATLKYVGVLPPYETFEPKRTSIIDYQELMEQFKNREWNFLKVSRQYIIGDVKALYQILIAFFEAIVSKFPINPLSVLSAPSTAFKIWRTVQLPILNKEFKVYDLSRSLDSTLREAYCGGIVDVYRPHLVGQKGYYYDVNSLYPTAMCQPMPVGIPTLVDLNPNTFKSTDFFGFVKAWVEAPKNEYIGLLPVKWQGKLVCPGGTFEGFFFSEELKFALNNGYTLHSISKAYKFERGNNTFLEIIKQLNEMKIQAQLQGLPTLRNLSKLLMNSMYGRFGMHTDTIKHAFLEDKQIVDLAKNFIIKNQIDFGDLSLVVYTLSKGSINLSSNQLNPTIKQFIDSLPGNTNVAIASAVTAYSRMIINQYKLKALGLGLDIFYSDTDSLVLNGPLPEDLVDSTSLGKLKLEHTFKEGIFVMPKVYYLELEDGTTVTKTKGLPGKLTKEQYLELLSGNTLNLTINKWNRSMRDSKVQIQRGVSYSIKFSFNKRLQVFENGKWVNRLLFSLSVDLD